MPQHPHRPRRRSLAALLLTPALLLSACGQAPTPRQLPPDDIIRSAQQQLTDRCLKRQGLTPPRPHNGAEARPGAGEASVRTAQVRTAAALFGTGRTELFLELPTGYTVRAHTDGCLAAAQRTLYGDQRRWFQVSTIANNLKPEATYRHRTLASVRAEHREELADWRTLRARALHRAKAQLSADQQKEKHA
ncbi:hypothetical protein M4V62_29075 [Streptomyces durmitorensis]|uniref:Lipoprotein n=1 Tax=Streptomyces durmitorensis TaxID=319947 RepID=A0ABY4PZU6_9ACTN|nr:hypothetical protein [Streptomyces durmitorensis]UQT58784.1 hypothetical protein M4V62_29075 [Streptomyces durmitorensis]